MESPFGSNMDTDAPAVKLGDMPEIVMVPGVVRDAPPLPTVNGGQRVWAEDRVEITLEDNDNIGPNGQFFGAQGVGYLLKTNIKAIVPLSVISILNTAVMSIPVINEDTRQVTGFRNRLRFPYTPHRQIPAGTVVDAPNQ